MSIKLQSRVWDSTLETGLKIVLGMVCDAANDAGVCWPSQERLAAKCRMTTRTLGKHLNTLEALGLITRARRQKNGRRSSDMYQVHIERLDSLPENLSGEKSSGEKNSPEKNDRAYPKVFPELPENFSGSLNDEPSENHQIEPSLVATGINPAAAEPEFQLAEIQTAKPAKPKTKSEPNPDNVATWQAYARAYRERYGVLPASNAKTRGQTAQLVRLVGREIAPHLAAYFVSHNNRWFVQSRHEIGCLLRAYQQVLTDMQRGEQMTQAKAQQAERTQGNLDAVMQSDDLEAWERYQRKQHGVAA